MTTRTLEIQVDQTGNAGAGLAGITGKIGGLASLAAGAGLAGIAALGAGMVGAGVAGLSMNNSMEQAGAVIQAFTKDNEKTAEILAMVKDEAAKTPFAFNDMATAAGALIPSAKQASVSLQDIIRDAEILAASNPAQGLEGAAFALKEAVSGDFTSVIERFNLPRQMINQLKEEGVPNLEIVRRAMAEVGLDMDLVSSMAETAEGRWSTFKDTMQDVAAQITQPIFDAASEGLGELNKILEDNKPAIDAFSKMMAGGVKQGITWLSEFLPKVIKVFQDWKVELDANLKPALMLIKDAIDRIAKALGINAGEIDTQQILLGTLKKVLDATVIAIQAVAIGFQIAAGTIEKISEAISIAKGLVSNLGIIFKSAMDGISRSIDWVITRWRRFTDAVRSAIDAIPDWLLPGSPTPFEVGLRGIAAAAQQASKGMETFAPTLPGNGISVPQLQASGRTPANAGSAGQIIVQLTYSPVVSLLDKFEAEQALKPFIEQGVRMALAARGM